MNDEQKRHLTGAIRNNLTHQTMFEPVQGHRFAWRDNSLYRVHDGGGQTPVLAPDEIYSMDDATLHARIMGEEAPASSEDAQAEEEEIDTEGLSLEGETTGEETTAGEPAPVAPRRSRRSKRDE